MSFTDAREQLKKSMNTRREASVELQGGTVAPRIQSARRALSRQMTKDQVAHLLEGRKQSDELVARNVLRRGSVTAGDLGGYQGGAAAVGLAPRIQRAQRELEHKMRRDSISHLLEQRPEIDDLEQRGVLQDVRIAPSLQGPQRELQHNLAKSNLYHALRHRPSVIDLVERGIYVNTGYYDSEEEDEDDDDDENDYYEDYSQIGAGYNATGEYEEYDPNNYGDNDAYARAYAAYEDVTSTEIDEDEDDEVDDDNDYYDADAADQEYYDQEYYDQEYYAQQEAAYEPSGYQRRSKNFHLTRILLKFVASMAETGEISSEQKGYIKDLIVDQDKTILAVAETFDAENDLNDFKDSLIRLSSRR